MGAGAAGLDVAANPGQVHGVVNSRGGCVDRRGRLRQALVLLLALAFLFESWIWDQVVAVGRRIVALVPWAEIRAVLVRQIDRLPMWVVLLTFGIPFVVAEAGSAFCVFIAATGHVIVGGVGYVAVKIFGLGLVVPIFDITRQRLLTLRWFAFLHEMLLAFHEFAERLVAPYRATAIAFVRRLRERARAYWSRRLAGAEDEVS